MADRSSRPLRLGFRRGTRSGSGGTMTKGFVFDVVRLWEDFLRFFVSRLE